ncbi:DUF805 domain-containing protein [Chryseobacterium sp.]|uniref:DUF805 domain-containing protein n=1 Tax=Chryseobacterium sp. TaxID=1871047 RepID=UPI00289A499D|nr:DUF805 domain-containing protein [Chryseobacterium sp.]
MIHRILNLFSRRGRITRGQYFLSVVIFFVLNLPFVWFRENTSLPKEKIDLINLITLPLLLWILAKGAQRCHDRGNSGLYQLIPFYFIIMILGGSDYGVNKYGPNPKGEGNDTFNTTTDDFQNALVNNMVHRYTCQHCGHHHCNCNKKRWF